MSIDLNTEIPRNMERIHGAAIILNSQRDFEHILKWVTIIKAECEELEYLLDQFRRDSIYGLFIKKEE